MSSFLSLPRRLLVVGLLCLGLALGAVVSGCGNVQQLGNSQSATVSRTSAGGEAGPAGGTGTVASGSGASILGSTTGGQNGSARNATTTTGPGTVSSPHGGDSGAGLGANSGGTAGQ